MTITETRLSAIRLQQLSQWIDAKVENDLEKEPEKLAKQEAELAATDNAEEFRPKRRIADNLPPSEQTTKTRVVLDNYYTNRPITIQLNKALTPIKMPNAILALPEVKEAVQHLTSSFRNQNHFLSWNGWNSPFSS